MPKSEIAATSQARRLLEVALTVGLWILLGFALHPSPNTYLLLGIPLTAAFQRYVRRGPLWTLWVRDSAAFHLDAIGWAIAAALAAYPCYCLIQNLVDRGNLDETIWYLTAMGGAIGAAYALRNFRHATIRDLLFCLATAGVIGTGLIVLNAVGGGLNDGTWAARLGMGAKWLLLYIPVVFVLEEVSFRGAFDAHVFRPGDGRGFLTSLVVSGLWGLWHVPLVYGQQPLIFLIPSLIGVHCAIGVPLSIAWRRSNNLFVPGSTHALIDAVRNALLFPLH